MAGLVVSLLFVASGYSLTLDVPRRAVCFTDTLLGALYFADVIGHDHLHIVYIGGRNLPTVVLFTRGTQSSVCNAVSCNLKGGKIISR